MKGLLIKDILNMKNYMKQLVLVLIFFIAYGIFLKNGTFVGTMITLMLSMQVITTMSYDEYAKWDKYALTMNINRKDIIISKYIFFTISIIIGIVVGVILSALKVDFPIMIDNTINNFAKITTPLALLAIGGSFEIGKALKKIKPAVIATTLKLIGWPIIFLPLAVMMGFRNSELLAIVIMLGSPTTPSCYVMAKSMKSEGTLTSSVIVLTTMFSAFSITAIIFVLRTMGYL